MAVDFIKNGLERMIKNMMLTKEQHMGNIYQNLIAILPESEIERHEIERIINNYEAICGSYVKQSRKKLLRSLGYLNRRLYLRIKPELSNLNSRLERINEKISHLEKIIDE